MTTVNHNFHFGKFTKVVVTFTEVNDNSQNSKYNLINPVLNRIEVDPKEMNEVEQVYLTAEKACTAIFVRGIEHNSAKWSLLDVRDQYDLICNQMGW